MTSRKKSLYTLIFNAIKQQCLAEPDTFVSDYEHGMRTAAKEIWPNIETPGCCFHHRQAIRRNYMSRVFPKPEKLSPQSTLHKMVRRMVVNLQFLPAHQIIHGASFIRRYQRANGIAVAFGNFNKYYLRYWLRTIKPQNFSMYRRPHRTNNVCVTFNAQLNKLVPSHPNIYNFLHRMVLLTIESNQKRQDDYRTNSKMTGNLEVAWTALEAGLLPVERFIALDFNNQNLQI